MGRYFFAVRNHVDFRDHTGQVFPGPKEAIRYAEIMARELARLQHLHGASLEVTDEQGNLLSKLAIQPPFAPEQIEGTVWLDASSLIAGVKMLLGVDPKKDYQDNVAKVALR